MIHSVYYSEETSLGAPEEETEFPSPEFWEMFREGVVARLEYPRMKGGTSKVV